MWDLKKRFNQDAIADLWLPQPNDEPMNEYYREKFEIDLAKQTDFYKRERDLVWWQRYSPAQDAMPTHMMYPDMYNMMSKTLNFGGLDKPTEMKADNFQMFTLEEFDPFAPIDFDKLDVYDGGTYSNGVLTSQPTNIFVGGQYANGVLIPPTGFPSLINGGSY